MNAGGSFKSLTVLFANTATSESGSIYNIQNPIYMRASENRPPWVYLNVLNFCVGIDSEMQKQKKRMRAKERKIYQKGSK
jgi:hypothetical protein